jgi:DNA-binding NarL/FixJ family response regulator
MLIAAILSQMRYGLETLVDNLLLYAILVLSLALAMILFRPELNKVRQITTLTLNPAQFTERDAEILRKILGGQKYEAIAREHGVAEVTLKKLIKRLYNRIGVEDRTNFLARYANFSIQVG